MTAAPYLLPGYRLNDDNDLPRLIAPNRKEVCVFGPGADPREIERECREHAGRVDAAIGLVERILDSKRSR